jgi:hypothetical protein
MGRWMTEMLVAKFVASVDEAGSGQLFLSMVTTAVNPDEGHSVQ